VAVFKLEQGGVAYVAPRVVAPTYTPSRAPIQTRPAPKLASRAAPKVAMHKPALGNASAKQSDEQWESF
jgi:hypothetical protein